MKHSNQVRMEFNIHKGKNKAGVFPTSLCKECGATKAPAFYKGWIVDGFSRADVVDANKSSLDETIRSFLFWVGNIPSGHDITLAGENPKFDSNFLESSAKRYNLAWPFSHRTVDLHTISYAYRASRGIEIPLNKARCSNLKQDETLKYVGLLDEPMPHNGVRQCIIVRSVIINDIV